MKGGCDFFYGVKPSIQENTVELPEIKILSSHSLQNNLLAQAIEKETGISCIASNRKEPFPKSDGNEHPSLVLYDLAGQDLNNLWSRFDDEMRRNPGQLLALFNFSSVIEPDIETKAISRSIKGIFYADESLENFVKGILAILRGELWYSRITISACILKQTPHPSFVEPQGPELTLREKEILIKIAAGASNKEIADELFISPNTVKTHIYNIFKKIHVTGRLQASLWVAKNL